MAAGADLERRIRAAIRDVPDHPRAGIVFKDITPLLADSALYAEVCGTIAARVAEAGITQVAAVESRGFLFGGPVAQALGAGLVPLRKPGKLPRSRVREEFALEYGTDALEMHTDAIDPGARILLVDDVLATGGTAAAGRRLVERQGGVVVACAFLLELGFLHGRTLLPAARVESLVVY
jgi:adenine phosphoribosyltransferase